jgi:oxaloacetate decarboxylase alpha subunit
MCTEDMLPIAEQMDEIGFHSVEVWGGATFDVCLRYLNEDPWERLRKLKSVFKRTPLQMLLRGQSLVGYQHYPDDVAEAFVYKMVENGIDVIRVFDALNDIRNMQTSITAGKKSGAHVQAAVVYTISPVHTTEHYIDTARYLAQMGADSICIKDMAGLLAPYRAYELVRLIKEKVGIMVQLHSHYIGGLAVGTYIKAAEAGVDVIDTASVPLAFGASQPPVETVVRALKDTPYDTGLDMRKLFEMSAYFETLRKNRGQNRGVTRINDMRVFEHQVPGGMISNLVTQLEEQKALHRLEEVLEEIPRVREELGYPPLVTPTSQIVGTQAVLNVLTGQRYKLIPGEVKAYVQGLYGKPPASLSPYVVDKVLGGSEPHTCRPADLLEPRLDKVREEAKNLVNSEEDVLSYAMFPQVAKRFLENRKNMVIIPAPAPVSAAEQAPARQTEDKKTAKAKEVSSMNLQEIKELIKLINETDIAEVALESAGVKLAIRKNGVNANRSMPDSSFTAVAEGSPGAAVPPAGAVPSPANSLEVKPVPAKQLDQSSLEGMHLVTAPMVGTFYSSSEPGAPPFIKVGDRVEKGQVLCIVEAMKLMNEIESDIAGEVVEILAENACMVEYGQTMFVIKPVNYV